MNNIKLINVLNEDLKKLRPEDIKTLSEKFFLFSERYLEDSSKWIFAYLGDFRVENIVGFMELNRYPIVGNATMSDKKPIFFDAFEANEFLTYEFEGEIETLSRLDTFIVISNVEVLRGMRCQGIGTSMYKYLEDLLTTEDSLIELTRTIDGREHNLLSNITEIPVFTNIQDLYDTL